MNGRIACATQMSPAYALFHDKSYDMLGGMSYRKSLLEVPTVIDASPGIRRTAGPRRIHVE
jgi:hypothetical protein